MSAYGNARAEFENESPLGRHGSRLGQAGRRSRAKHSDERASIAADQADAIFSRGIVLAWVAAYFLLTRAAFLLALAVGSSGDRTILSAGLSRVTLLSPILWAS